MTSEEATTELRNILRVEQNRIHKDFVLIGALKMAVKALHIGEPCPMLEWQKNGEYEEHPEDRFRDVWKECLVWA